MVSGVVLTSEILERETWLEHGFGTRHDGAWTPYELTARLKQTHSATFVSTFAPGHRGEGDALLSTQQGLWLEIRTADCVPVLIADPGRRAVAAVHAGWRGTAARIIGEVVERMVSDGSRREALLAAIGPAIGACCFEVGEDVATHFPIERIERDPRPFVDLIAANRRQLVGAGLQRIDALGLCTHCDAELFHSFRRDKGDGRMVSAIRVR